MLGVGTQQQEQEQEQEQEQRAPPEDGQGAALQDWSCSSSRGEALHDSACSSHTALTLQMSPPQKYPNASTWKGEGEEGGGHVVELHFKEVALLKSERGAGHIQAGNYREL